MRTRGEFVQGFGQLRQIEITAHRHQTATQRQKIQCTPQVFADCSANLVGRSDYPVERTILREPFERRFWPHFGHARHVIDGIANERQIIDNQRRRHAELGEHTGGIERFTAHRIDQRDTRSDELRQILVAGRDQHVDALCCGPLRQRADHVVGLDTVDHQDRPATGGNPGVDRLNLAYQVIGHRRALGLILGVPVIAEGLALGIKDTSLVSYVPCRVVTVEAAQHVQHAIDGPCRLALRVTQVGHGMKGAIKIRGTVNQQQGRHVFLSEK